MASLQSRQKGGFFYFRITGLPYLPRAYFLTWLSSMLPKSSLQLCLDTDTSYVIYRNDFVCKVL